MIRATYINGLPEAVGEARTATDNPLLVPSLLLLPGLSAETRRMEEVRLAKLEKRRIALRERKPYTRKRGTVHPKKKIATRRRLLIKQWALRPRSCLMRSYGSWSLPLADWNRLIAPLWEQYDSKNLTVRTNKGNGYREKPHTVYNIDVYHKVHGKVYDGNSQLLYEQSS